MRRCLAVLLVSRSEEPQNRLGLLSADPRIGAAARRAADGPAGRLRTIGQGTDVLALETTQLKTAVCLGDLLEGYPLSDARPDFV
jgi:hypothetical protein